MRREVEEVFITEDGMRFTKLEDAENHEIKVVGKHFESMQELIAFLKETSIWKVWDISVDQEELDIYDLHTQVGHLAAELKEVYPKIYIGKNKRKIDLDSILWDNFSDKAVIDYFNNHTHLEFSDEKILGLYQMAFFENHAYGLMDTVGEFSTYIEVLNLMYPKNK